MPAGCSLTFAHTHQQQAFQTYLHALDLVDRRIEQLERELDAAAKEGPWAQLVARLRCLRGVDTLTALGLVAEIGTDWSRFETAEQFMSFVGLVPSERSCGQQRSQGSITKAGNGHVRRLLVEAAWHQRQRPRVGEKLAARQRGQDPLVLEQQVPEASHAPVIARLRCFRGIDTLSAAGICAEVGSFARFPRPPLLSGFLGIVPSERTSDTKLRQGTITKAGPPHARRLLVEAAQHYRHQPAIGEALARRQHGQDPGVIEARPTPPAPALAAPAPSTAASPQNVVAIACARELAGFLWEPATLD